MLREKDVELARLTTQLKATRAEARGLAQAPGDGGAGGAGGGVNGSGNGKGGGHSVALPDLPLPGPHIDRSSGAGASKIAQKSVSFAGEGSSDGSAQSLSCRIEYLAKAFKHFVLVTGAVERANLARVICQLLCFNDTESKDIVDRASTFISTPMGMQHPLSIPSLEAIEQYSIEQFSVENVGAALGNLFGFSSTSAPAPVPTPAPASSPPRHTDA
jgi:hypothetical protein